MTTQLVLRPEAINDLRDAFTWYETQRAGLGDAFLRRVRQRIDLILENPGCFPIVLQSIRRAPLKRFPYGVYYEHQGNRVVILAVYHFKRSPEGLASRI